MLSAKMIDSINQLFARSGIQYTKNPVADDFMNALFRAEGKKAGNPEFDPSLHDFSEDNSFWLGCRDEAGKLIATIAARRIEAETFLESCRSYRLWYGDRLRFTEPLDLVDGPYDRIPHGSTSFLGAAWVRPDWRGRGLSWALTRLCYFLAIEQWRLDWLIAMVFSGPARSKQLVHAILGPIPTFENSIASHREIRVPRTIKDAGPASPLMCHPGVGRCHVAQGA